MLFDFPFETLNSKNAELTDLKQVKELVSNCDNTLAVIKINLPVHFHREAIHDLYSMNIDAASLFPGLNGFARSLSFILREEDEASG